MKMTDQQYLNCILNQYQTKQQILHQRGIEIRRIYMNNKTATKLKQISRHADFTVAKQTFMGHEVIIAELATDIIDVGIDFSGLTY
jgi:hypothetical protein